MVLRAECYLSLRITKLSFLRHAGVLFALVDLARWRCLYLGHVWQWKKASSVSWFSLEGSTFRHVDRQAGARQETERSALKHAMRASDQPFASIYGRR
jgi:hypothetical protein